MTDSCHVWIVMIQAGGLNEDRSADWYFVSSLQKEKCTAPELAERFEVSRRTINRDIEALCRAGNPHLYHAGSRRGYPYYGRIPHEQDIADFQDMQMILAGLRSLDSVSGSSYYRQLMEKLQVGGADFVSGRTLDRVFIDLSSWYKESLAPKLHWSRMPLPKESGLHFIIMRREERASGRWSRIIWCSNGPAGMCGAGVWHERIFVYLN